MDDCVFCRIIERELPAHYLYEDEKVIVILDHRPIHQGHAMVIPKQHVDYFINLDDELASHIVMVGNMLGRNMIKVLKPQPKRIGFVIHGYIPHVHYHVLPQYTENDITSAAFAKIENNEILFDAERIPIANDEHQMKMAKLLRI